MIFRSPPQFGPCSMWISNTRLSRRGPLMRKGQHGGSCGSTTCARSLATCHRGACQECCPLPFRLRPRSSMDEETGKTDQSSRSKLGA